MSRLMSVFHLLACCAAFAQAPGLTGRKLEFGRDIHPVLNARCASCHSRNLRQGGLSVSTVADLRKGGVSGAAILPGNSAGSLLIDRLTGAKPPLMPMGGPALSEREIALIREWIDRGASVETGAAASAWQPLLKPRNPAVPGPGHPVDAFLKAYWTSTKIAPPALIDDERFLRRAFFDLHGLPPTPDELTAFHADRTADKRARRIDTLLSHRKRYAEHWISFWNDLLHNDEGVVYHGERKSITPWLLKALESNLPYDKFVAQLLNPAGPTAPEGFLMGVNWRGDINASQTPAMQAAQNSAQVFLGINIKCASCHDSFINQWKLKDAYGLASFFTDKPLEVVRCDTPTGEMSQVKFLYSELGAIEGKDLRSEAARLFTHKANGRFARTFVNRMWQRLIGHGLVENADDMDGEPWSPDLLDWLASDFAANGYNVDHLVRRIMTSSAYQLPAVREKPDTQYVFKGPSPRRLTAEQYSDAVSAITGQWRTTRPANTEPAQYVRDWRLKASPLSRALGRPVRDLAVTYRAEDPSTLQALEMVNGGTLATVIERGAKYLTGDLPPSPEPVFDSGVTREKPLPIEIDLKGLTELRLVIADAGSYDPSRVITAWKDAVLEGPKGTAPVPQTDKVRLDEMLTIKVEGYEKFRATTFVDRASIASDINARVRYLVYAKEPDPWRPLKTLEDLPHPAPRQIKDRRMLATYLFQYALSRQPSPAELKLAADMSVADLLWSLTLSPEFAYIH
jgi:hypothetical protein